MKRAHIPITPAWGIRLALCTALISGLAIWLNSYAIGSVGDAAVYTTMKNMVAALVLVGAASAMGGAVEARRLDRGQWLRLLIIGVIGGSVPFLLFFVGLSMATAPSAAFIHKTLFIWVAFMAVPFLGERLAWVQIAALGVLLVGQILLVAPVAEGVVGVGELMIFGATLLWSVEIIVAKRVLAGISPAVVGAARLGIGVVLLIGFVVATGKASLILTLPAEAFAWVLLTGVLLAGYVATWYSALRRAPASVVAPVLVVGAVVTAGLNVWSRGLVLDTLALLGLGAIVMAAIVMAFSARREVEEPDETATQRPVPGSATG
ncbi:MAG: DMT family transporter [Chloroflexota bacterium]